MNDGKWTKADWFWGITGSILMVLLVIGIYFQIICGGKQLPLC